MSPSVRAFLACVALFVAFLWALDVAGEDVVVAGAGYGSSIDVATTGVDECGCEPSPEPDPHADEAVAVARDQLRPLAWPGGLALVSLAYLCWLWRAYVRRSGRPFRRAERPWVPAVVIESMRSASSA